MRGGEMKDTKAIQQKRSRLKADQNLDRNWKEIEKSMEYLRKTDRSGLTWRELLGRPHECNH